MQLRSHVLARGALTKPCRVQRRLVLVAPVRAVKVEADTEEKQSAEVRDEQEAVDAAPTTQQVKDLLTVLTDQTEFAELKLEMGSFNLIVRRDVVDSSEPTVVPSAPAAVAAAPAPAAPTTPVTVTLPPSMRSASATTPMPYLSVDEGYNAEESIDESLTYCLSPKVGVFRRGRYAAGKRVGKGNVANEGAQVRKGQTLGYIEQLGTFVELKSSYAGEIVSFKVEDGEPIEYHQALVAIAPYFGVQEVGVTEYR